MRPNRWYDRFIFGIEKPLPWSVLLWPFMWVWGFVAERWHRRAFEDFEAPEDHGGYYDEDYDDLEYDLPWARPQRLETAIDPFWNIQDDGRRELALQGGGKLVFTPSFFNPPQYPDLPDDPFDPTEWFADDLLFAWEDKDGVTHIDRHGEEPPDLDRIIKRWIELNTMVDKAMMREPWGLEDRPLLPFPDDPTDYPALK